ncbi:MAG TPA: FliH/SctL family protein [Rubrivivax sp.]|nr:FliH/SctL family protein [Rubrivivax sp.]
MTTSSSRASRPAAPQAQGTGTGRTASSYSRFIPREELGAFAAWHPDTLNPESDAAPAAPGASAAPAEGEALQQRVAAARQAGYQDGYRDGLVALDSFKQSFATQMTAQLGPLVQALQTQLDALEQQMAQAVADSAVLLARRVVRAELRTHPEQVAELATQAVNAVLQSAKQIRVLVHADDHALVAAGAAEALQARGARLLAQPGIERGGCVVESDLGRIDARIEARWRQAAAVLGSELPWDGSGA